MGMTNNSLMHMDFMHDVFVENTLKYGFFLKEGSIL